MLGNMSSLMLWESLGCTFCVMYGTDSRTKQKKWFSHRDSQNYIMLKLNVEFDIINCVESSVISQALS